jgi:hypothetical protein
VLERPFRDDPATPDSVQEFGLRYNTTRSFEEIDEDVERFATKWNSLSGPADLSAKRID